MTARIDGTVMVDNPAYPGDAFCQGPGDPPIGDCDAPKEVERNIDTIITDVRGELLWIPLFAPVLGWLFIGVILHIGSWLAGAEGRTRDSFAVAAWGLVPSILSTIVAVTVLWFTFDPITVSNDLASDKFLDLAMAELGTLDTVATVLGITTALWSAYIHVGGLVATRGVPQSRAVFIAGIVAFFAIIGTL